MGLDIGKFFTRALHIGDDKIKAIQAVTPIVTTALTAGKLPSTSGVSLQAGQGVPGSPGYAGAAGMSTSMKAAIGIGIVAVAAAAYLLASK